MNAQSCANAPILFHTFLANMRLTKQPYEAETVQRLGAFTEAGGICECPPSLNLATCYLSEAMCK